MYGFLVAGHNWFMNKAVGNQLKQFEGVVQMSSVVYKSQYQ